VWCPAGTHHPGECSWWGETAAGSDLRDRQRPRPEQQLGLPDAHPQQEPMRGDPRGGLDCRENWLTDKPATRACPRAAPVHPAAPRRSSRTLGESAARQPADGSPGLRGPHCAGGPVAGQPACSAGRRTPGARFPVPGRSCPTPAPTAQQRVVGAELLGQFKTGASCTSWTACRQVDVAGSVPKLTARVGMGTTRHHFALAQALTADATGPRASRSAEHVQLVGQAARPGAEARPDGQLVRGLYRSSRADGVAFGMRDACVGDTAHGHLPRLPVRHRGPGRARGAVELAEGSAPTTRCWSSWRWRWTRPSGTGNRAPGRTSTS